MTAEEQRHVKRLLLAALEAPAEQRSAVVLGDSSVSDAVRQEVLRLLEARDRAGNLVTRIIESGPDTAAARGRSAVGPYEIIRTLGRGGSAVVYLAKRRDQLPNRVVALKVFEKTWHYPGAQAQFEREISALAKLEHANIVRLYEGGATEDGLLYLAMEYVDGIHLDRYCKDHRLSMEDRLRLLLQVCDGVAYANLRLIVHRDLKPSNILVTSDGVPKILDFGVSKLLQDDGSAMPTTRSLTIRYSSPEQLQGGEISVASDVYSLGVNAYEVLVGASPYRALDSDLAGLTDAIVHQEVIGPRGANSAIPADLQAILHRALRKEVHERYRSVDAMADDIRRLINGQPVVAHEGNAAYRFRKFVRRNRLALAAAVALLAAVATGATVSFAYARAANQTLEQTLQISGDVLSQLAIMNSSCDRNGLVEIAKRTQSRLFALSLQNPDNRKLREKLLALMLDVGEVQGHPDAHNLGDPKGASETFRKAIEIGEELFARDQRDLLASVHLTRAHCALGTLLLQDKQLDTAEWHYRRAADIHRDLDQSKMNPLRLSALATALMYQSEIAVRRNDLPSAIRLREEIIAIRRQTIAQRPQEGFQQTLAGDLLTYGTTLRKMGRIDEALGKFEEALQLSRQLAESSPQTPGRVTQLAWARLNIGLARLDQNRPDQAAAEITVACQQFLDVQQMAQRSASSDRDVAICKAWRAIAELRAGRRDSARLSSLESLEIADGLAKKYPADTAAPEFAASIRRILSDSGGPKPLR